MFSNLSCLGFAYLTLFLLMPYFISNKEDTSVSISSVWLEGRYLRQRSSHLHKAEEICFRRAG